MYKDEIYIYRGARIKTQYYYNVPKEGIRSTPRDTQLWIHNELNKQFSEKNGYNLRNGIFCTQDIEVARAYGTVHLIIPTNNTTFFIHESIGDFTGYIEDNSIEYQYEIYCKENGLEDSQDTYKEFIKNDIIPSYINNIEQFGFNDHINQSENEISAFGEMYIMTLNMAEKLIDKVKGA